MLEASGGQVPAGTSGLLMIRSLLARGDISCRYRPEAGEDATASSLVGCQSQAKTINAANIAHVSETPRTQNKPSQLMHARPQSLRCFPHNHSVIKNATIKPRIEMKHHRAHVHYSLLKHLNYLSLSLCFEGPSKIHRAILHYFMLKRIHLAAVSMTRLAAESEIS